MSDPTGTAPGATDASADPCRSREAVVRFSHVDAAGIVFYPRYIEMLAEGFPGLAATPPPFELEIEFSRPAPLGTRLTLAAGRREAGRGWQLSGTAGGEVHFTMTCTAVPARVLEAGDHEPARAAFRSAVMPVAPWSAGPDRRLHLSRYYEFVSAGVEQWFEQTLDLPFGRLHADGAGIPTVLLATRCAGLPVLGEETRVWIRPTRVGGRSVRFDSFLVGARGCLIKTTQVIVFIEVQSGGLRSVPLPRALAARLRRQLAGEYPE